MVDQSSPVTTSEQQAVPVAQIDWRLIAKAAGEHGVRYRTNTALLAFLDEIEPARKADRFDPAHPCKSGEGAGERRCTIFTAINDPSSYAGDRGQRTVARWQSDAVEAALATLTPDATQTREAELVALIKRMAARETDQGGCLDITSWLIEADRLAAHNARGGA